MMLMRFRRYRVFLIFATILTFCLYRFSKLRGWDDATNTIKISGLEGYSGQTSNEEDLRNDDPVAPAAPAPIEPAEEPAVLKALDTSTTPSVTVATSIPSEQDATPVQDTVNTIPGAGIPDRKPERPDDVYGDDLVPDGRKDVTATPTVSPVHWKKQKEHFPIPQESLIQLPTGKPVAIRKIQYNFNDETRDAKIDREKKQDAVKGEFKRAWAGYKQNAWLQDELSPVTGKFRNPFCGWAATLVDSLDTLWIMGLEEEFEEAANAVDMIDFTTSPRSDIPMFETTIRYLGGLLAAYDVSNGKYGNLLGKAVELAEILMGAFDTPNRMPILFYRWKPAFASQPHRASNRCNLAEFGSLSMEFTRLAQLTGEPKYYDAIARITDALADFQTRGTKLDGVFPNYVDASGCNNTKQASPAEANRGTLNGPGLATPPNSNANEPEGFKPQMPDTVKERKPKKGSTNDEPFELQVISGDGGPSKAHLQEVSYEADGSISAATNKNFKRAAIDAKAEDAFIESIAKQAVEDTAVRPMLPAPKAGGDASVNPGFDCRPQGLESSSKGRNAFSMGGGQDSTYEYFPKQYLLLGGHDDTYRSMYMKTIEAVRKHMLFRPMVPDERDILFSGAVSTSGHPEIENDIILDPEITHLTCFIGGMVGMAAKLFDIPGDIEIAKKLTDGCVWAYEVTETGIMPEFAKALPCADATSCPWNETLYWEYLDPMGEQRDINAQEVKQNIAILADTPGSTTPQDTDENLMIAEGAALKQAADEAQKEEGSYYSTDPEVRAGQAGYLAAEAKKEDNYHAQDSEIHAKEAAAPTTPESLNKRQLDIEETTLKPAHDFREDSEKAKAETFGQSYKEVPKAPTHDFREDFEKSKGDVSGQSSKEVPKLPTHDFRDDVAEAMAEKKAYDKSYESEGTYKPIGDDFRVYVDQPDDSAPSTPEADSYSLTSNAYSSNIDDEYQRKLADVEYELDGKVPVVMKPKPPPPGMPTLPGTPTADTTERPLDPNGMDRNTLPSSSEQANKHVQIPLTHEEYVKNRIEKERLPKGMVSVISNKYILRPEAIESVWYMYRITGDPIWQEKGWRMYESIIAATHAEYGNSAIADVTNRMVTQLDEMESFWLAETLKYFYLLFSTPDVISLDDWVLNTEAHPFKRPKA